ncbi:uncharacterized protein LOC126682892 [Mercurialis annua]|uniref:uncharacterized protein LOC126682892 n=1 Tax=Mercurialis annua TaxID=3986 RepID=UPI00215E4CF7|nr:uncharacterized protein LOC126682892 [Mercurialis annua]
MGFKIQNLIFLLILLIISIAEATHEIQPKNTIEDQSVAQYQVFYLKNTTPFILDGDDQEAVVVDSKNKNKNRKMTMRKRKIDKDQIKNFKSRTFSVMLPKGFVPPSGSSPCHNDKPNFRVSFYCDLSTTMKP